MEQLVAVAGGGGLERETGIIVFGVGEDCPKTMFLLHLTRRKNIF